MATTGIAEGANPELAAAIREQDAARRAWRALLARVRRWDPHSCGAWRDRSNQGATTEEGRRLREANLAVRAEMRRIPWHRRPRMADLRRELGLRG